MTTLFEASEVEIKMELNKLCSNLGVTVDGVCCCCCCVEGEKMQMGLTVLRLNWDDSTCHQGGR